MGQILKQRYQEKRESKWAGVHCDFNSVGDWNKKKKKKREDFLGSEVWGQPKHHNVNTHPVKTNNNNSDRQKAMDT